MTVKRAAGYYGTTFNILCVFFLCLGMVKALTYTPTDPYAATPSQIAADQARLDNLYSTMEYTRAGQSSVLASTCESGEVVVVALGAPDAEIVSFDEAWRQSQNGMSFVLDKCED